MQGVIYARYSSDNQREESIEGQIRENTAYAQKNGIDIVGTYIDRAYSAKTDNRPEFQRMIKDSAKKGFDVVIVWKLDRFSRNRYDSAKYKAMLRKNDVKVVSATESISGGAEGIILESVLEGMAEYYSADLAEKVSRGMTENALKCRFNGGNIPFGYMIDEEQHYQPDPEKAPLVIEMFRRYAGGESITDIVEDLNARGIRTSKGNRFNKNSLARIFANRRYIGEYAYKEIVVPNAIPPIVSKDIFERVAIRMKQNKHATGKAKAPERYLLTTKLFCGTCQSMFVGDSANKLNGTIYRYYKCASAKRHECDRKAIRKDWIEDKVIEEISAWLNNDKLVSKMADDVMALLDEDNEMVLALEAQLKDVRDSIDNIMKAIEKGVVTRSTKSRLEELEAEEEKIILNIKLEEAKRPKITKEFIIFTLNKFRNLDLRFEKNKERLIDGLVKAIFVYDDYIKLILTFDDKPINIPTSDEIENMANSSDIQSNVSPTKIKSELFRNLKRFGFFLLIFFPSLRNNTVDKPYKILFLTVHIMTVNDQNFAALLFHNVKELYSILHRSWDYLIRCLIILAQTLCQLGIIKAGTKINERIKIGFINGYLADSSKQFPSSVNRLIDLILFDSNNRNFRRIHSIRRYRTIINERDPLR